MNDKKLSKEQAQRTEDIKKEWFSELDRLKPFDMNGSFSHSSNAPRIQLEKKYVTLIRKILDEDDNE